MRIFSSLCLLSCTIIFTYLFTLSFPGSSAGKESACIAGDLVLISGSGISPGMEMANHSNILAWKISWTEDPGGLQSMASKRVGHNLKTKAACRLIQTKENLSICTGHMCIPRHHHSVHTIYIHEHTCTHMHTHLMDLESAHVPSD